MSILNAIKEVKRDNNNLQDMALLPQALIMQMAQRGEIQKELVPLIISKKAEMIEAVARQKALMQGGAQQPSVMEQNMMEIAQAENPAPAPAPAPQMMPQQMAMPQPMPQGMPQLPEEVGIAQNPVPPMQLAGGGIIAFAPGGNVDDDLDDDDDYEELLAQAEEAEAIRNLYDMGDQAYEVDNTDAGVAYAAPSMPKTPAVGIKAVSKNKEERSDDMVDRLRAQIMAKESGGRRYDKEGNLLTSSKGALGEMQVMPYTSRDPGFGIRPARSNDPDELRRVGDEYAAAMYKRYGDPKLAMIAYNMGPGATDKWLAAGANPRDLPKETQGYIRGVSLAGGGEVKHFQGGGTMAGYGDENYDMDALRVQEAEAARKRKEYEDRYEFLQRTAPGVAASMTPPTPSETRPVVGYEAKGKPSGATEEKIGDFLNRYGVSTTAAPAAQTSPQQKAEDETFNLMQYIKERQAKIDKAALQDQNLALLAAGLGIMGGTSPYAFANIGQGGAQGVAQLGQLQKLRAQQGIASDKLLGTAANYAAADRFRRDQLAQNKEMKEATLAGTIQKNKADWVARELKDRYGIDSMMLGQLNFKKATGDLSAKDAAKLKVIEDRMRDVERQAETKFPTSTAGMKIVGVRG